VDSFKGPHDKRLRTAAESTWPTRRYGRARRPVKARPSAASASDLVEAVLFDVDDLDLVAERLAGERVVEVGLDGVVADLDHLVHQLGALLGPVAEALARGELEIHREAGA